jgi:hypothetical protein
MPTAYVCDTCQQTSTSLEGWFLVSVSFLHMDVTMQNAPPGGRMLDSIAPDLVFDKLECRQAWCTQAGIADPGAQPAAAFAAGRTAST